MYGRDNITDGMNKHDLGLGADGGRIVAYFWEGLILRCIDDIESVAASQVKWRSSIYGSCFTLVNSLSVSSSTFDTCIRFQV